MREHVSIWQARYKKYQPYWPAAFFLAGFLFDIVTLDRIDSTFSLVQQSVYLVLMWVILIHIFLTQIQVPIEGMAPASGVKGLYQKYRTEILHFIFGSLLSSYTLFFFVSSSLVTSFVFMMAMAVLLVANEWSRFQSASLPLKFAVASLCLLCYSLYLTPTLIGSLGVLIFIASLIFGYTPIALLAITISKHRANLFELCKKQILIPSSIVFSVILILYVLRLIPPVPLSIQYIGIYHNVAKSSGVYQLSHERPWWKFWQNGDQSFVAQPGDQIYVFFRLFSPSRFADQVYLVWMHKDERQGWVSQDRIPIQISGGRDLGFRGYGVKSNYMPGKWRVLVETVDQREISRINFNLELSPEQPREFQVDQQ